MNTAWKYWIAAISLLVWLILVWFMGSWMNLAGKNLWVFRIALGLIGVAAFATVVWLLWAHDKERAAQMGAAGPAAGPDEIDLLIRDAEARLKASQLGPQARIGNLPLYFVVGEPGSAKTSVVLHCGLEPELLAGHVLEDNVPVATRTLNVWYTRQVLFAEAGGPLLSEPWRWAKLVKKLAPRRFHSIFGRGVPSPRAALVCIDCESFMAAGAAEALAATSDRLRTRLRDISQLLGISLPVYVLLTRTDRLQFFQDYVRNLSNDEASLVLGTTLPMVSHATGVYAERETARLSAAFDTLFHSLANKRLPFLSRELDKTKLPTIYEFPREFGKLRALLVRLLVDICRPSQLRAGPFLRGFYFTGVRPIVISTPGPALAQEAPPPRSYGASEEDVGATKMFDMRKAKAQALQQPAASEGGESRRIPQWVFLPHLFNNVLLGDAPALSASVTSTQTSLWRRILLATAMVFALIFILAFIISFARNKSLENQVMSAAQEISKIRFPGRQLPSLDELTRLEQLRQPLVVLADYQENGRPTSMGWGLYFGNSLYPNARRVYFHFFHQLLFGETQADMLQSLRALPVSPGPNDQYTPVYETLKAYLITTSNHDKSTLAFLSPVLQRTWAAGRDIDPSLTELAGKQFDFYSGQLQVENPYSSENDTVAVARARHYLTQMVGEDQVYGLLRAEANKANPSINFNSKYPGSAEVVVDSTAVEGAFTKTGWAFMHKILQNLPEYFSGEEWVLGAGSSSNLDLVKLAVSLESRYQQDFIAQWRAYLRGARVVGYSSLPDASQKLQKQTRNDSPLLALFCTAAQNIAVGQADVQKAFQPVLSVEPATCEEQHQYIGASNQPYITGLSGLQACLDQANNSPPDQKEAAKAQCANAATTARQPAQQIAQGFTIDQDAHIDQTVQNLLLAPITSVSAVLVPGPVSGQGLCAQMTPFAPQFPFNARATADASLADLSAFFDPATGALSQFYNTRLKDLVIPQGTTYAANPDAGQKVSPAFLAFFNRAKDVQRALYAGAQGQLQYRYALRPHPTESVSSLTMTIDGQSLNFQGGNASFQQFTWPGAAAQGVKLTVKMSGGSDFNWPSYDGTWGVFHFFADADESHPNGNTYTLEWVLRVGNGRPVTTPDGKPVTVQFDLDTLGQAPVLQKGFLANLHCVSTVAR